MSRFALVDRAIDVSRLVDEVRSTSHGAISIFIGTVRETNNGRDVMGVEYTAYASMAEDELKRILAEAEHRFDVSALVVEHRIGFLQLEDISVAIVAAHAHRAPALDCTRFVIEQIKARVPIWKKEHYVDGAREWVDPTSVQPETLRA
jgi:molybdopterin synthase catalytic subunit